MGQRLQLQSLLEIILGSRNVYFQPPETVKIAYPCIIFRRSNIDTGFADDALYIKNKQYQVIVVDVNPDSLIPEKVLNLPMCQFDRHYTANNLNHDVFNLYY